MTEKKTKISEFDKIKQIKNESILYNIYRIQFVETKNSDDMIKFIPIQYNHVARRCQDLSSGEVLNYLEDDYFSALAKNYENVKFISTYSYKELSERVSSNLYEYFTVKGDTKSRSKMQAYLVQNENDMLFDKRITTKQNILEFADKSAKILNRTTPLLNKYHKSKNALEEEIIKKVYEGEELIH